MGMLLTLARLVLLLTIQLAISDATDPEVQTVPSVALEFGKEATLTCGYDSTVYAVFWRFQSGPSPMESLVTLDQHYQVGERSGPGYVKGRFNITDDYSLIIHEVQVHDEGRYTCEVSDFGTGRVFRNHTDVIVDVIAEQPFVRIRHCEDKFSSEVENAPCILHAKSDQYNFELSCSVVRAKPEVKLSWISSEQWDQEMNTSTFKTLKRSDGAFDQTLTISINTSQFINQSFTCVAEGLAVSGIANQTIKVFVVENKKGFSVLPDDSTPNITRIAVLSAVAALGFTLILVVILWKAITYWKGGRSRIEQKRSEIKNITEKGKDRKPFYFGVFGEREAGKSTFIDSLIFAFTGGNHKETSGEPSCDGTVWRRSIKWPSKFIALCEIRDMEDVDLKKLKQLLQPISTNDGDMRKKDVIHYPVIVYDIGKHERGGPSEESLVIFSEAVKRFISEYPILVLTHITASEIPDRESIIFRLSEKTHIPVDNIFFTGTKKVDDITTEDDILQLLDILLKCLKNVTGETVTRQIYYRKQSSKRARGYWKQLSVHEDTPSKEDTNTAEWERWKDLLNKTEESTKLNEGQEKV